MFPSALQIRICACLVLLPAVLAGCRSDSMAQLMSNPFSTKSNPTQITADSDTAVLSGQSPPVQNLSPDDLIQSVYDSPRQDRTASPAVRTENPQLPEQTSPVIHQTGYQSGGVTINPQLGSSEDFPWAGPIRTVSQQTISEGSTAIENSTPVPETAPPVIEVPVLQLPEAVPPASLPRSSQFQMNIPLAPGRSSTPLWEQAPTPNSIPHYAEQPSPNQVGSVRTIEIPVGVQVDPEQLRMEMVDGRLTLMARKAPLSAIVTMIAQQHGLNVVISDDTDTEVTMSLSNTSLRDALDTIVAASGCTWVQQRDIIIVTKISAEKAVQAHVQGRQVRVIPLNFISASDAQAVVSGLLSPVGKIFIHQSDPTDKLKARETVIVEDLPESLARIEQYIATVDQPPRQVLIEAHILQVVLDDSCRHGVNLSYLTQIAGADFTISSGGFANPMASPALLIDIDGSKLNNVVEAIRDTTDSKTLASPKVLVLNGQEAKIQIGERLGFQVTTTTQTSTVQNVQFLDTGVVLSVTPQITQDGQILMKVKPEVSTGNVNPLTGLPDKETAEVDTTVMLPDGHGIVIGGLIQELDAVRQSKIPFFGDLRYIGRAFQRRTKTKERTEIIIALVPRILPYDPAYRCYEESNYQRATSPLLYGPLISAPRPEPQLFDAINNPRHWRRGAPVMNDCQDCQICPEPVLGQGYSAGFPEPMITPSLNTDSQTFTPVP